MRRPHARPFAKALVVISALSLLSVACGDDADDEAVVVEPVDEEAGQAQDIDEELLTAIEAYGRTVVDGDPDGLAAARSSGCAVVDTELSASAAGADAEDVEVSDVEAEVDGDKATVDYRLDPAGEQISDERWVREDGEWKWDNC